MKTTFFLIMNVTVWLFILGCEKEDIGPTPELVSPEVLVRFDPDRTQGSEVRADLGTTITFAIEVFPFERGSSITGYQVYRSLNGETEELYDDSQASTAVRNAFEYPVTLGSPTPAGSGSVSRTETFRDELAFRFSFSVSSGNTIDLSYLVRINRDPNAPDIPPGPISVYEDIRMITVSLNSDYNQASFFSTSNGIAYSANTLVANPENTTPNVDFGPTVAVAAGSLPAISSVDAMAAAFDPIIGPVRPFQKTIQFKGTDVTAAQFDEIRDDIAIIQAWENGDDAHPDLRVQNRRIINLDAGKVFVFQTDETKFGGSKLGLLRVKSVIPSDGAGNAEVIIDVKVQTAPKPINTYAGVDLITVSLNSDYSAPSFFSTNLGASYSVVQLTGDFEGITPNLDMGPTVAATEGALPAISSVDAWAAAYDPIIGGARPFQKTIQFLGTALTPEEFDAIEDDALIISAWENGDDAHPDLRAANRRIINLEAGKVFAFQTDETKEGGSKLGLIKIVGTTPSDGASNARVIFDIKVQQ